MCDVGSHLRPVSPRFRSRTCLVADVFQIKRQLTIIAHNLIDILEDASCDFCVRLFQLAALKEMKHLLRKWTLFNQLNVDERMRSSVFSTRLCVCVWVKQVTFNASECCSGGGNWDSRLRYFTSSATCSRQSSGKNCTFYSTTLPPPNPPQ